MIFLYFYHHGTNPMIFIYIIAALQNCRRRVGVVQRQCESEHDARRLVLLQLYQGSSELLRRRRAQLSIAGEQSRQRGQDHVARTTVERFVRAFVGRQYNGHIQSKFERRGMALLPDQYS